MKFSKECLPCLQKQIKNSLELLNISEKEIEIITEKEIEFAKRQDFSKSPAEIATYVHQRIMSYAGGINPYENEIVRYNNIAKKIYPELKNIVRNSKKPLYSSAIISLIGNTIDLTFMDEIDIEGELKKIEKLKLKVDDFKEMKYKLESAEKICFLSDNAGEVFFDRVFIEEIKKEVLYIVNQKPILNEATIEDGKFAGMEEVAKLISDGSEAIGVIPSHSNDETKRIINESDIIISKGQANFEIFEDFDYPTFFLLRAKCRQVADKLGVELGDYIIKKNY